jgi:hypothetical protein
LALEEALSNDATPAFVLKIARKKQAFCPAMLTIAGQFGRRPYIGREVLTLLAQRRWRNSS